MNHAFTGDARVFSTPFLAKLVESVNTASLVACEDAPAVEGEAVSIREGLIAHSYPEYSPGGGEVGDEEMKIGQFQGGTIFVSQLK
jgi:hypothetical protein